MFPFSRLKSVYRNTFWSKERLARFNGVKIGSNCVIGTKYFGSEPYLIEIGDRVQITNDVKFFTHGGAWVFREQKPSFDFFGKIKVGNNVYVGNNVMIMPGVTIGNNVIIGAGSIVTKSLDSDFVYAGNPARKIDSLSRILMKVEPYNVGTYGMSYEEKRKYLEALPSRSFLNK